MEHNGIPCHFFQNNDFTGPEIPPTVHALCDSIKLREHKIRIMEWDVFCREADPPSNVQFKGDVLLFHGQSFSSQNWVDIQTPCILAAAGYRTVTIDIPGYGKTGGNSVPSELKGQFTLGVIGALNLRKPVIVSPSMSGTFALPIVMRSPKTVRGFIPVAPVGTAEYTVDEYEHSLVPTLIVYGERDTSLGTVSVSNLRHMPNSHVLKISQAGHAVYLHQTVLFHTAVLNFLDLLCKLS